MAAEGTPPKPLRLIKACNASMKKKSEQVKVTQFYFETHSGVQQGCALPLTLFNIDWIPNMRHTGCVPTVEVRNRPRTTIIPE